MVNILRLHQSQEFDIFVANPNVYNRAEQTRIRHAYHMLCYIGSSIRIFVKVLASAREWLCLHRFFRLTCFLKCMLDM